MTWQQYEALCRVFLADMLKIDASEIREGDLPGSHRPGSPAQAHQVDLFWTTRNAVSEYFNIANAKWRTGKVKLSEVLTLPAVREEVAAQKAVMITNTGFQSGALKYARDKRIGLYVLRPEFDCGWLPRRGVTAIVERMRGRRSDVHYHYEGVVMIGRPPRPNKLPRAGRAGSPEPVRPKIQAATRRGGGRGPATSRRGSAAGRRRWRRGGVGPATAVAGAKEIASRSGRPAHRRRRTR